MGILTLLLTTSVSFDMENMLRRAQPGQVISVPAGIHVGFTLADRNFTPPVTVRGPKDAKAVFVDHPTTKQAAWIQRSSGLRFENLHFASRQHHALHVDGVPFPQTVLSQNIELTDCEFISLGTHYGAKLSQARLLLFDRCRFLVPEKSAVSSSDGGCLDAVAVDDFILRNCTFEHQKQGGITLMIKGGAKNVVVRDCLFRCPSTVAPLMLAGQTDPSFRTRANVKYELENFTFKNNKVYFAAPHPSEPAGLHGVWDSVADATFTKNEFHNTGQILFVGKKTVQDLLPCRNITFQDNTIFMRPTGFSDKWSALIVRQGEERPDGKFVPFLTPDQFHAKGNIVHVPQGTLLPVLEDLTETGFELRQP